MDEIDDYDFCADCCDVVDRLYRAEVALARERYLRFADAWVAVGYAANYEPSDSAENFFAAIDDARELIRTSGIEFNASELLDEIRRDRE